MDREKEPLLSNNSQSQIRPSSPYDEVLRNGSVPLSTSDSNVSMSTVPCPTCMGSGKVPRDHPVFTQPENVTDEQDDGEFPVSKEMYANIRKEMREQGITQEVFAAVSFGRTQGLLSEMLKKADKCVRENRSTRQNLHLIQEFLAKPVSERIQMYKNYKMESKEKRRMRREYYEDGSEPTHKKKMVIPAVAKGVMLEYFEQIAETPDKAGLEVMSNELNLDKDIIQRFFKHERARRSLQQFPQAMQQQAAEAQH